VRLAVDYLLSKANDTDNDDQKTEIMMFATKNETLKMRSIELELSWTPSKSQSKE